MFLLVCERIKSASDLHITCGTGKKEKYPHNTIFIGFHSIVVLNSTTLLHTHKCYTNKHKIKFARSLKK